MNVENVSFRLPVDLDLASLRADLARVESKFGYRAQYSQFTNDSHNVDWGMIPLRNVGGRMDNTSSAIPSVERMQDTEAFAYAPYFQEVLGRLGAVQCVRISALPPGKVLSTHSDHVVSPFYGTARLHIPILTNERVTMTFAGRKVHWPAGQLWYGDFRLMHSVENGSSERRVHLLIDVDMTDRLFELLPELMQRELEAGGYSQYPDSFVSLSRTELDRYACEFRTARDCSACVPWNNFKDGELDIEDTSTLGLPELPGTIFRDGDELHMSCGQHVIALDPISPHRFHLRNGLPGDCMLFELDSRGKVETLAMETWSSLPDVAAKRRPRMRRIPFPLQ